MFPMSPFGGMGGMFRHRGLPMSSLRLGAQQAAHNNQLNFRAPPTPATAGGVMQAAQAEAKQQGAPMPQGVHQGANPQFDSLSRSPGAAPPPAPGAVIPPLGKGASFFARYKLALGASPTLDSVLQGGTAGQGTGLPPGAMTQPVLGDGRPPLTPTMQSIMGYQPPAPDMGQMQGMPMDPAAGGGGMQPTAPDPNAMAEPPQAPMESPVPDVTEPPFSAALNAGVESLPEGDIMDEVEPVGVGFEKEVKANEQRQLQVRLGKSRMEGQEAYDSLNEFSQAFPIEKSKKGPPFPFQVKKSELLFADQEAADTWGTFSKVAQAFVLRCIVKGVPHDEIPGRAKLAAEQFEEFREPLLAIASINVNRPKQANALKAKLIVDLAGEFKAIKDYGQRMQQATAARKPQVADSLGEIRRDEQDHAQKLEGLTGSKAAGLGDALVRGFGKIMPIAGREAVGAGKNMLAKAPSLLSRAGQAAKPLAKNMAIGGGSGAGAGAAMATGDAVLQGRMPTLGELSEGAGAGATIGTIGGGVLHAAPKAVASLEKHAPFLGKNVARPVMHGGAGYGIGYGADALAGQLGYDTNGRFAQIGGAAGLAHGTPVGQAAMRALPRVGAVAKALPAAGATALAGAGAIGASRLAGDVAGMTGGPVDRLMTGAKILGGGIKGMGEDALHWAGEHFARGAKPEINAAIDQKVSDLLGGQDPKQLAGMLSQGMQMWKSMGQVPEQINGFVTGLVDRALTGLGADPSQMPTWSKWLLAIGLLTGAGGLLFQNGAMAGVGGLSTLLSFAPMLMQLLQQHTGGGEQQPAQSTTSPADAAALQRPSMAQTMPGTYDPNAPPARIMPDQMPKNPQMAAPMYQPGMDGADLFRPKSGAALPLGPNRGYGLGASKPVAGIPGASSLPKIDRAGAGSALAGSRARDYGTMNSSMARRFSPQTHSAIMTNRANQAQQAQTNQLAAMHSRIDAYKARNPSGRVGSSQVTYGANNMPIVKGPAALERDRLQAANQVAQNVPLPNEGVPRSQAATGGMPAPSMVNRGMVPSSPMSASIPGQYSQQAAWKPPAQPAKPTRLGEGLADNENWQIPAPRLGDNLADNGNWSALPAAPQPPQRPPAKILTAPEPPSFFENVRQRATAPGRWLGTRLGQWWAGSPKPLSTPHPAEMYRDESGNIIPHRVPSTWHGGELPTPITDTQPGPLYRHLGF